MSLNNSYPAILYMKKSRDKSKKTFIILGIDLIIVITTTDISLDLGVSLVTRKSLIKRAMVVYPPLRGSRETTIIEKSKIFQPFLK